LDFQKSGHLYRLKQNTMIIF